MTAPRSDQILRQSAYIGELGQRIADQPRALLDLCDTIAGLIGGSNNDGPKPKGSISDPTGAQALTDDQVRRDLNTAHKAIDQAHSAFVTLSNLWQSYVPNPREVERRAKAAATVDEIEACRTHRAAGLFMVAGDRYKGMCRRCGDFRAAHNVDPSPALIRALDSGRRLTPKLIAEKCPEALGAA